MRHRIPNIGEYVHAWTQQYGEFIIKVTNIFKPERKKRRVRGIIIKILKSGEKPINIGIERDFGIISIRDLTTEESILI